MWISFRRPVDHFYVDDRSEAVFTSMPGWLMDMAVSNFTARGEELGIVHSP